jgi:proteasome lid subunit RPN8/RPN11
MMNEPDIRLLSSESLGEEHFPGGRNEAFRVYFTPEVHAALWKHAGEDTSVEICGVLVGTWHRDEVGPFAKVVESIRGEGAEKRFAEVTFTHQTWSKINAEMDTTYAHLKIVGWYHTHPDFGIFLSDRDRFIQEHFFSGPGQVAHVIDPIRRTEGVFIWRDGKPTLADHFWVGDRILARAESEKSEPAAGKYGGAGTTAGATPGPSGLADGALLPPPGRLIMYISIFLIGYLLATVYSSWERQRYIEAEIASNGVAASLRIGLADELDSLQRDLAAVGPPLEAAQAKSTKADLAFGDVRKQLASASRRAALIQSRYANTPAVDDYLRRLLLEKYTRDPGPRPDRGPSNPPESKESPGERPPAPSPPATGSAETKKS